MIMIAPFAFGWKSPGGLRRLEKLGEALRRHFAGRHHELAVTDLAEPRNMAIDRHVVGRVHENGGSLLRSHQSPIGCRIERAPAQVPVLAEEPNPPLPVTNLREVKN